MTLLFAAALGMLMLGRLQTYITKPIVGLTNSMRVISSTDNYALRFNLDSKDELGELANGFNIMLSRIQSHQTELDQSSRGGNRHKNDFIGSPSTMM